MPIRSVTQFFARALWVGNGAQCIAGIKNVDELVHLDDDDFVDAAYRVLLGRDSDSGGKAFYMSAIRQGEDKVAILRQISSSPEAMEYQAKLRSRDDRNLVAASNLFDEHFYRSAYQDVAAAGVDPLDHYMQHGWKEGRNPSPRFNTSFYLSTNDHVQAAKVNPLVHYLQHGIRENRPKLPSEALPDIALIKRLFSNERRVPLVPHTGPIDIVIPIYNGFEYLAPLFDGILRNSSLPFRLLVVNDCSPDSRVSHFLSRFAAENSHIDLTILENQKNLGFIGSVNRAIPHVTGHFVLLNSDTEVPPAWLERLMYPILTNRDVASTTPFTNSGTICSFPTFLEDNPIFEGLSVGTIDAYFQLVVFEESMLPIPTGVGFCMGINKHVVDEIGMFDPVFGRGYGEENDWCMRARSIGYRNVHVANLFVYHKHGGSFTSTERQQLIQRNLGLLRQRHPGYEPEVQRFIQANPLRALREFIVMIIASNEFPTTVFIDNELGGGAHQYRISRAGAILDRGEALLLIYFDRSKDTRANLRFAFRDYLYEFSINAPHDILELLQSLRVRELIVNSLVSFPGVDAWLAIIQEAKSALKCKLIYMMHDYFSVCPSYTLLNDQNAYCGVPMDLKTCERCLALNQNEFKLFEPAVDISQWRSGWREFLEYCDEIVIFSKTSLEIIRRAYSDIDPAKISLRPHDIAGRLPAVYQPKHAHRAERIGILGGINTPKGSFVIRDLVGHIDANRLNAKVVLFGEINVPISSPTFKTTGRYDVADLPALVRAHDIDVFLVPSIWPETYSFTTDEIIQMGFPLVVFNLGAPAERVADYRLGKVIEIHELYRTLFDDDPDSMTNLVTHQQSAA